MKKVIKLVIILAAASSIFLFGMYSGFHKTYPFRLLYGLKEFVENPRFGADETASYQKKLVKVSTSGNPEQPDAFAYFSTDIKPLVVSLHAWNADWTHTSLIAAEVVKAGWNYIHPDFQGVNNKPSACLSDLVIEDIDRAIDWMVDNGKVDISKIYLVGASGGGYSALGYRSKTSKKIKATFAWVPITDLTDWYYQSRYRGSKYYRDIIGCAGGELDFDEIARRSPVNYPESSNGTVTLYTGINDGYQSSVPTYHSLKYFNKFAKPADRISDDTIHQILTKGPTKEAGMLGKSRVFLDVSSDLYRLIVFDGGHEIKPVIAFEHILQDSLSSN